MSALTLLLVTSIFGVQRTVIISCFAVSTVMLSADTALTKPVTWTASPWANSVPANTSARPSAKAMIIRLFIMGFLSVVVMFAGRLRRPAVQKLLFLPIFLQ